jgi:hypothetical protein
MMIPLPPEEQPSIACDCYVQRRVQHSDGPGYSACLQVLAIDLICFRGRLVQRHVHCYIFQRRQVLVQAAQSQLLHVLVFGSMLTGTECAAIQPVLRCPNLVLG